MSEFSMQGATPVVLTADGAALTLRTWTDAGGNTHTLRGRLVGLLISPTGAVTPTVTVYDNTSAAGTKIIGDTKIVSATPFFVYLGAEGVEVKNGVFVHADAWTTLSVTAFVKG